MSNSYSQQLAEPSQGYWQAPYTAAADGELLALPEDDGLPFLRYVGLMLAVGFPVVVIVVFSFWVDMPMVGLAIGATAVMVLALYRPELGLYIIVALVPWQEHTMLAESTFSAPKAVGIIISVVGLIHIYRFKAVRQPKLLIPAFGLCVFGIIPTIFEINRATVLGSIALFSNVFFMYLLSRFCSTPKKLRALFWFMVLGSMSQGLAGLFAGQLITGGRLTTHEELGANTFVRLLFPGVFLAPILIVGLRNWVVRIALMGGIVACLIAALLTGSRGAMVGLALGMILVLLQLKGLRPSAKMGIIFGAMVLLVGAVVFAASRGAGAMWKSRLAGTEGSAKLRMEQWKTGVAIGIDNMPFGTGIGMEAHEFYLKTGRRLGVHNDVLSALIRTGPFGMICYIWFVLGWLIGVRRLQPGITRSCLLGLWMALTVTSIFNPCFARKIFWMCAGASAAAIACYGQLAETKAESLPGESELD